MTESRGFWWFAAVALPVAIAFAILSPPMQTPDEVGHYWRATAIATGQFLPERVDGRPSAMIPNDSRDLVFHVWMEMAGKQIRYESERLARAWPLRPSSERVRLSFPSFYTPAPYLPQAAVIAIGRAVNASTLGTFYAGRIVNAVAGVVLVMVAMRLAPHAAWIFAIVASTPMFLYLCGSFSADVVTAGAAFCTTAAAMRLWSNPSPHSFAIFGAAALLLTVSKPAYFPIALLLLGVGRVRGASLARAAGISILIVIALLLAAWTTREAYYPMRPDVVTDAPKQLDEVKRAPLRFVRLAVYDYAANHDAYYEHFVGRLGWLDIALPRFLRWLFGALFIYVACASSVTLAPPRRMLLLGVFAVTLLVVSLSQYLIWTAVGANEIHGIQGRYFLPVAPLLLLAFARRFVPFHAAVPALAAIIANGVALFTLFGHYYGA